MKIKEVMQKAVLIGPDTSKKELLAVAKKHPNMPIFVVVDKDKKFMGEIHENDLFYMLLPNDRYEDIGIELAFDLEKKFFADTAKELMRKHGLSCGPDDDIMEVALKFASVEENEMPVLDRDRKVIGVITQGILLRQLKC